MWPPHLLKILPLALTLGLVMFGVAGMTAGLNGMLRRVLDVSYDGAAPQLWTALAALYAFVPMFAMPGSAVVWGSGAVVFLTFAVIIAVLERLMPRARELD